MTSNYTSHNMKKIISNIETSRSSITSKKNIPANLASLKQTFAQLDSSLKGQAVYIKDLDLSANLQSSQQIQKPSQQKKNLMKMIDMVYQEVVEYTQVCKQGLSIGLKDKKETGGWDKMLTDIWKRLEALKSSILPTNIFEIIFKLLNLRDNILKQLLKGMIYQKHLLWLDLKMPYQSYVHSQIQSVLDIIKTSPEKYGFVPTKLEFSPIPSFSEGRWNLSNQKSESSVPAFLSIALKDFRQIIDTIKNYSLLNQTSETFQDINKNQVIVKGLREKIEQHSINYNVLLDKYRSVQAKDSDGEMKAKLDQMIHLNAKKDHEINLLHTTISSHESTISGLKQKQKQLEEELMKLNVSYYPKLKEVDGFQKALLEQFLKIRREVEVISVSLENDNQLKNRLQNQIKDQKELVNNLVNILGRQRRKIAEMKQQNKKLDQLVSQLTNKHFPQ